MMAGQFAAASSAQEATRYSGLRNPNSRGTTNTSIAMMVLATGTVTAPMPVTYVNVWVRLGRMYVSRAAARPSPTTVYWRRQRGIQDSRFCAPLIAM